MTLGEFREWTKTLPDTAIIGYHAYYKGCAISSFDMDTDCWIYNKNGDVAVVLNPGKDYDDRRPNAETLAEARGSAPNGSAPLIRNPAEALKSHRREGWNNSCLEVFAVMESESGNMRIIMSDGRSGDVVFDHEPNKETTNE